MAGLVSLIFVSTTIIFQVLLIVRGIYVVVHAFKQNFLVGVFSIVFFGPFPIFGAIFLRGELQAQCKNYLKIGALLIMNAAAYGVSENYFRAKSQSEVIQLATQRESQKTEELLANAGLSHPSSTKSTQLDRPNAKANPPGPNDLEFQLIVISEKSLTGKKHWVRSLILDKSLQENPHQYVGKFMDKALSMIDPKLISSDFSVLRVEKFKEISKDSSLFDLGADGRLIFCHRGIINKSGSKECFVRSIDAMLQDKNPEGLIIRSIE